MKERLWFVAGAVCVLLLVTLLTFTAHAMGRSELYGQVLQWRMQSDSVAKVCAR